MHHQVRPRVRGGTPSTSQTARGRSLQAAGSLTSGGVGDTREGHHAASTSSVDAAAPPPPLGLIESELVRGSGGQMEAPHGSHAFEKKKKKRGRRVGSFEGGGGGNQQPTDGKVKGM